jgi:hypothetical protein
VVNASRLCSKNSMVESDPCLVGRQRAALFCARAETMTDEELLEQLVSGRSEAHAAFVECAPYWDHQTRRRVAILITRAIKTTGLSLLEILGGEP